LGIREGPTSPLARRRESPDGDLDVNRDPWHDLFMTPVTRLVEGSSEVTLEDMSLAKISTPMAPR